MRRLTAYILIAVSAAWLPAAAVRADDDGGADASVLTRPPRGSLAAQLRLKMSLQLAGGASLAAAMDHNRQEWEMLSPDQREQYRSHVLSTLRKSPEDQDRLMRSYATFLSLNKQRQEAYRRRAEWVKAVVATFTPQQREALQKMSSVDRAKALIARRDELMRQGKLTLDEGASQPATAPAPSESDG